MRRRRKEIQFSFDSFLDLVANVVGIILRLILVAWVGARCYKAVIHQAPLPPLPALVEPAALPEPTDPRSDTLPQRRLQIAALRQQVDQTSQKQRTLQEQARQLREDIAALQASRQKQLGEQAEAQRDSTKQQSSRAALDMDIAELKKRSAALLKQIDALRRLPASSKQLAYRAPISADVQSEELMFECRRNKVALIDTGTMLAEVKRELRTQGQLLKTQWQVSATTEPVGAFRLRYHLERERSVLDTPGNSGPEGGNYRYSLTGWEVEPIRSERGEAVEQALQEGSAFRRLIDSLDSRQVVVTLWVYPDSFALYRRLRDHLHDRGFVVAGRPLPEGHTIASSRHGTRSRGQ